MNYYIETSATGYTPEQCGTTITVSDLIGILEDLEPDGRIYLRNDNGGTFGRIRDSDIVED